MKVQRDDVGEEIEVIVQGSEVIVSSFHIRATL